MEQFAASTIAAVNVLSKDPSALLVSDKSIARMEFDRSQEGKRSRQRRDLLHGIGLIIGVLALFLGALGYYVLGWNARTAVLVISGVLFVGLFLWSTGSYLYSQAVQLFVPEESIRKRTEAEEARRRELTDTSLPAMLKFNRDQMVLYHTIATTRAKSAGRNSQIAISVGFLVLTVGALVAIFSDDLSTKIVTATLASLGGIFSGYITKTFFVAQDRAIQQLTDYWQQPLATSYLLAAERIAAVSLSKTDRDEQLKKLIERTLAMSARLANGEDSSNSQPVSNGRAAPEAATPPTG
jgi:hypothetical protein